MASDDPYANKVLLGQMVRAAANAAIYGDDPDVQRANDISVCEVFVAELAAAGCMITRIPTKGQR